jgi:excisionase family DNA binding protein
MSADSSSSSSHTSLDLHVPTEPARIDGTGRIVLRPDSETLPRRRDVARRYGVSLRTLDRWVRERKIPYIQLDKRTIRFRWADVERAVERMVVKEVS